MKICLDKWNLKEVNSDFIMKTQVPGDIIMTLYENKVIEDPIFGLNHLKLKKDVTDKDYTYFTTFEVKREAVKENEEVFISFEGVDLFSDIYLNGQLLGSTKNMFLEYVYNISDKVIYGKTK